MNKKQWISLLVLLIGVAAILYAVHGTQRMQAARTDIDRATGYIPKSPARETASGILHGEVDKYKTPVTLLYVGGAVFIVAGAVGLFALRKKK